VTTSTYSGTCKPAFQLLNERVQGYVPALASKTTGIPAQKILEIAHDLAKYKPAVVIVDASNPSARWTNALQNKRALKLLPMLLGTHDQPGGRFYNYSGGTGITARGSGYPVSSTIAYPLSMPTKYSTSTAFVQARVDFDPNLNGSAFTGNGYSQNLRSAIMTGTPYPVKMLFINAFTPIASNPPATTWRQIYTGNYLDMIVYGGIWYEEDADYADVILPEAMAHERSFGYSGFATMTVDNPADRYQEFSFLVAGNQVVQPAGDVKSSLDYFTQIANLAGFGQYFNFKFDDVLNWRLQPMGTTIAQLRQSGTFYPTPIVTKRVVYGTKTSWTTDSGRLNVYSPPMAALFLKQGGVYNNDPHLDPLPLYVPPTRKISASNEFYLYGGYSFLHRGRSTQGHPHLTERYLDGEIRQTSLWINASTAAALGIKDKNWVLLQSSITGAKTQVQAKVTHAIHPHMVLLYTGFGRKGVNLDPLSRSKQGANDNDFVPTNYSPWTGGGARDEAPVTVTKVTS